MKVYVKNKIRRPDEFMFFMHQFVDSAIRGGIEPKKEFTNRDLCYVRLLLRKVLKFLLPLISRRKKKKAILVPSQGRFLVFNAFPYYRYEIIPMLWDVWHFTQPELYRSLRLLKCKTVFVTVKAMAGQLTRDLGVKAYWIPEGIDVSDYQKGEELCNRKIDIYELGRQKKEYHEMLEKLSQNMTPSIRLIGNEYDKNGSLKRLAFPTAQSLLQHLNQIKVVVSFPRSDTHPDWAEGLETLTQRYWEAMLSGCLIVGRAPQELIDLIGYNPVIDIDWDNSQEQIRHILTDISSYQDLVDKNYAAALRHASWDNRIELIKKILKQEGYVV